MLFKNTDSKPHPSPTETESPGIDPGIFIFTVDSSAVDSPAVIQAPVG